MKYIRTKDGIVDISNYIEKDFYYQDTKTPDYIGKEKIIKQADTIEELCDCFVKIKRKENCKPYILKFDYKDLPKLKEQAVKYPNSPVYGAIHIEDKGLIYVAKMKGVLPNGEIDWDLL